LLHTSALQTGQRNECAGQTGLPQSEQSLPHFLQTGWPQTAHWVACEAVLQRVRRQVGHLNRHFWQAVPPQDWQEALCEGQTFFLQTRHCRAQPADAEPGKPAQMTSPQTAHLATSAFAAHLPHAAHRMPHTSQTRVFETAEACRWLRQTVAPHFTQRPMSLL
jgi:hypothetical protein